MAKNEPNTAPGLDNQVAVGEMAQPAAAISPGLVEETSAEMLLRLGTDAMKWAEEIAQRRLTSADDLLGWCANMLQAGADAATWSIKNEPVMVPDSNPNTFTITLKPQFADYVRTRSAAHGEAPEQHIPVIVMRFWQQFDEWRRETMAGHLPPGAARPGRAPG